MESKKLELAILSVLFAVLSVLIFFVFKPFLSIIVLGAVLAVLFHPLYKKLVEIFHGGKSFASGILVLVALIFLIAPILFFGLQIFGQAQNFLSLTQISQLQYIQALQQNINIFVARIIPNFTFNISDFVNNTLVFVYGNFSGLLSQTTYIFFQTFFLLFTFFFLLRDGDGILDSITSLSPFEEGQNKEVINSVYRTITSVIRGTLFVGLIRFIFIVIAFYFFGIPNAILWGSLGGIIGAVPGIGSPMAIIFASIYLLLYGNIFLAIGMVIFGIILFFFIDNLLSTYFFGKGLNVPSIFILFSILGGIFFFGPLGFIFGPIVLSLFISMVDMYKILILKKL